MAPASSPASARSETAAQLERTPAGWALANTPGTDGTPSNGGARSAAIITLLLSAFLAVIVFLPAEGRISVPLHDGLRGLLGRASFMAPLALALAGGLLVARQVRPQMKLPRRRLSGVALLTLAALPIEHVLGGDDDGTGSIGQWLSHTLLDLLGGAGTGLVLLVLLGAGAALAFELGHKPRRIGHTDAAG